MNCRQVVRLMSAYVDGELTGVQMLEIRRHVGNCPDCREEFESTRLTKLMVSRLRTVEPTVGFMDALTARLDEIQIPAYQRVFNTLVHSVRERMTPVTATFAAVSVALIVLSARSIDPVGPAQTVALAQAPIPQIQKVGLLNPEILEMKTEPVYSAPMSASPAEGRITLASFWR